MSTVVTPGRMLRKRAAELPCAVPYGALPGAPFAATAACSYAELDRRARAVAARLGGALPPGSRVLLAYRQGPDFAGAFYGCLYAGMVAVPYLLSEPAPGDGVPDGLDDGLDDGIAEAVDLVAPAAVLTAADGWSALPVNRERVPVLEADGHMVGGSPVAELAERWRPVGVLRWADAYRRYVPGSLSGPLGGRMEPPFSHGDLLNVLQELQDACRLGVKDEELSWIASVHGMDDAVWRLLLPVHQGRAVWETAWPPSPDDMA
ncbi:AMP-binding protein [Streptantibioticus rubrisoli]|uniref:AMP-binding protein n=1 Tax=Streptantibioticus rubrisoli TaxID=1387313 RepID=A0ABT1PDD1_9ACTN|nr:AMP-binding protein [Streptantibioticus rubrisoli]MCQ4042330.1 AMP-binding protein [Streptantibioticus rubrisoli]